LNQISELNIDDVTYTSQPTTCGVREKWRQVLCDQDDDGDTKLHLAIIEPHVEATRWLICATAAYYESFLDVANYEFHQTALHLAVITDQPNIVRLLVICGASTNLRDRRGNTALHLACLRGRARCVEEMTRPVNSEEYCQLMEYCQQVKLPFKPRPYQLPDLTAKDYEGRSCLHLLQSLPSSTERLRIIDYLVRNCSANINIQEGKGGCTLLHLSVKQRDSELFTYLLHLPCVNVNLPTYSQHTALDIADSLNYNDFVQQLVAVHAQHSPSYITNDSSSSDTDNDDDQMDEYDDLVVGGQRLTLNSR
jgi:ankyrin repeat protein